MICFLSFFSLGTVTGSGSLMTSLQTSQKAFVPLGVDFVSPSCRNELSSAFLKCQGLVPILQEADSCRIKGPRIVWS